MKRKILSVLLVAVVTGIIFIGCGKETDDLNNLESVYVTKIEEPEFINGYFEENNLIVEGAGVEAENQLKEFKFVTYGKMLGQEIITDYDSAIGINEKIDGDNKVITAKFELEENIMCMYGFADRYTGLCYIADKELSANTTIQADEKEYELSIDFDKVNNIITVSCPSVYNSATFFVCGTDEELLEENEKNLDKFVSISDIKHICSECGYYDMKFFAK